MIKQKTDRVQQTLSVFLVDDMGIEPTASALRTLRSPS